VSDRDGIERSDMRKFPREVQDLVLHLVNTEGIRWRDIDKIHLLLYPPDGKSRPFKIAASRPAEMQVQFIERQFMAVYQVKGANGHVPGEKEEKVVAEAPIKEKGIWGPDGEPAEAVRTLAAALGVSLGGTVSEEDYLAVVAEKDACQREYERVAGERDEADEKNKLLAATVTDLTTQRDELLTRVHDLEGDITQAVANLTRSVKT